MKNDFHLVQSLTVAEKRFITLVGQALAGSKGSKALSLFRLLNKMKVFSKAEFRSQSELENIQPALSTHRQRMRQHIFSCLQQLGSDKSLQGRLSLLITETETLFGRMQAGEALRAAERGMLLAERYGRYTVALEFTEWQRRILLTVFPADTRQKLEQLHQKTAQFTALAAKQQKFSCWSEQLICERRLGTSRRIDRYKEQLQEIEQYLKQLPEPHPDLLTESLYCDVQGLFYLATQKGEQALEVYTQIIKKWNADAEWREVYPDLYLSLFKNFQLSVFWGTVSRERIESYLKLLPHPEDLHPRNRLEFERIRNGHLITLGLNTGKFELVFQQIPLITAWLENNRNQLPAASQLAFRYNICISFFLSGNYREAYRQLQPILQHTGKGNRDDILEFSKVLQAILLYQFGDHDLNEYLLRSARSFFKRNQRQWAFEEAVLRYLNLSISVGHSLQVENLGAELAGKLERFAAESSGPYPLLGLTEVQCWLESSRTGKPIHEVFLSKLVKEEE